MVCIDMSVGYTPDMAGIGKRIKALREPLMNQTDLGKKLGVGQPAVSAWERDETVPDALQLVKIAVVLGRSVEDVVVGADPSYDKQRRVDVGQSPIVQNGTDYADKNGVKTGASDSEIGAPAHEPPRDRLPESQASIDAQMRLLAQLRANVALVRKLDAAAEHIRTVADALRHPQGLAAPRGKRSRHHDRHAAVRKTGTHGGGKKR
jgi:transcriptional regulator with XRE-family HTH domain